MYRRKLAVLSSLILAFLIISVSAFAILYYIFDREPAEVTEYENSDCFSPSNCLKTVDEEYTTFDKDTDLEAEWGDPFSGRKRLNSFKIQMWISPSSLDLEDNDDFTVFLNGSEIGAEQVEEPGWFNYTVTDEAPSQGPYRVRLVSDEQRGYDETYVDYMHLKINYTDIGTISASLNNPSTSGTTDVYKGDSFNANSTVSCSGGYCGNIASTLMVNDSAQDGTYFSTSDSNPPVRGAL